MKVYIDQDDYCYFKVWLLDVEKIEPLTPTNSYELLRWKNKKEGKPMPICFRRDVSDKITLNESAWYYYERFKRQTRQQPIIVDGCTCNSGSLQLCRYCTKQDLDSPF